MKIDRSKITHAGGGCEATISDLEYAQTLEATLRLLGAVDIPRHPYRMAIGFDEGISAVCPTGSNGFTSQYRFLMGHKHASLYYIVHPSRVNVFLNGGYRAKQTKA